MMTNKDLKEERDVKLGLLLGEYPVTSHLREPDHPGYGCACHPDNLRKTGCRCHDDS